MTYAAPPDDHTRPAELPARNLTRPGREDPFRQFGYPTAPLLSSGRSLSWSSGSRSATSNRRP